MTHAPIAPDSIATTDISMSCSCFPWSRCDSLSNIYAMLSKNARHASKRIAPIVLMIFFLKCIVILGGCKWISIFAVCIFVYVKHPGIC